MATFAFLIFVMLVATLNFGLGFVAAMRLGVGPKSWPPELPDWRELLRPIPPLPQVAAEPEPAPSEPPPAAEESITPDDPPPEPEPAPRPERHPLSVVLANLSRDFDRFEGELADWDNRRREEPLDADALTNSAIELSALAGGYLQQFQASLDQLDGLESDETQVLFCRDEIRAHANELSQQLQVICAELGSLQFEAGDPDLSAEKLTTALTQVFAALHQARDQFEEPMVGLVGSALHEEALSSAVLESSQASLLGRLAFEHAWHASDEARQAETATGCAAMVNVDGLRQLNAARGPVLARRALLAIGEITQECVPPGTIVARLSGKQFALCLPEQASEAAAEIIERVRQQVEHTTFQAADGELRMTVSAAVAVMKPGETSREMLGRLRATIREAKSYGRNRTFLLEESAPHPVVPPELPIEPRTLPLR